MWPILLEGRENIVGAGMTAHVLARVVHHMPRTNLTADCEPAVAKIIRTLATYTTSPPAVSLVRKITDPTVFIRDNLVPVVQVHCVVASEDTLVI